MEDGIENSISLLIEKELQKIELLQSEIVEKVVKRKRSKDIDISKEEKYMEEYLCGVKESDEIDTTREHLESYDENIEYIDDDADIENSEEKSEENPHDKPVYLYDIRGPGELTRNGWIKC